MAVRIAPAARQQFLDAAGNPYSGAKLFTYLAGTTTKQATYTTSVGNVANTNPIILDASGRTPNGLWLTDGLDYKFVIAPPTDTDPPTSPIYTEDGIEGVNDSVSGKVATLDLAASSGSSMVGFIQSGTGAVARTEQAKNRERVSPEDFGADPTGVANSAAAIQLAFNHALNNGLAFEANGNYLIQSTVYVATYYPTASLLNRPSTSLVFKGKVTVDGCTGFIVVGNGASLSFDKVIAANNASIVKGVDAGYLKIKFNDMIGNGSLGDGITLAGCFDALVEGQSLVGFNKCVALRPSAVGDNFAIPFSFTSQGFPPNNPIINIGRLGGDFNAAATDALSSEYGIHGSYVYGGQINAQTEYVIRSANSVGWYFDANCQRVKGINGYFESNNKYHIECYGTDCVFEVDTYPTNRETTSDFRIEGLRNELRLKAKVSDGNDFMNLTIPVGSLSATVGSEVDGVYPQPISATGPLNRVYAASDLSNATYWTSFSPTGGVNPPTLSHAWDATMDTLGGSFVTNVTAIDAGLYQYSQGVPFLAADAHAFGGLMVRGVSGKTRIMLKVTPGAASTARYVEVVLNGATDWRHIEVPVLTGASVSISVVVSFLAGAGAVCQVANARLTEHRNGMRFFKNYSATRPANLGGAYGNNLVENLNVYGRVKKFVNVIADASATLTTIEHSTYWLPAAAAIRTITLPVIATAGLNGTEVTFLRGAGAGSNWSIAAGAGDTFSSGAGPIVLGATDKAITLVAYATEWLIKSQR